jgi:hypothetical protein
MSKLKVGLYSGRFSFIAYFCGSSGVRTRNQAVHYFIDSFMSVPFHHFRDRRKTCSSPLTCSWNLINIMEQSDTCKADSPFARQEILHISWYPRVHWLVHRTRLDSVHIQIRSIYTLPSSYFKIHFNIIIQNIPMWLFLLLRILCISNRSHDL